MKAPALGRCRRRANNDKGRDGGDQSSRRARHRAPTWRRGTLLASSRRGPPGPEAL